jgi:hypothetical protein
MLLWFVGTAVITIWFVFGDERFDYRWLIIGSLLPSAVDFWTGGRYVFHALLLPVALLVVIMLATACRDRRLRQLRRSLLGLPLGILLHLVFTGAWADTATFWWPLSGTALGGQPLPEIERGWWNLPLEFAGAIMVTWIIVRAELLDPDRRRDFLRHGYLSLPLRR